MAKNTKIIEMVIIPISILAVFLYCGMIFSGCTNHSTDVENPAEIKPKVSISESHSATLSSEGAHPMWIEKNRGVFIEWDVDCGESDIVFVFIEFFKFENEDPIFNYRSSCEDGYVSLFGLEQGVYEKIVILFKDELDSILFREEIENVTIGVEDEVIL